MMTSQAAIRASRGRAGLSSWIAAAVLAAGPGLAMASDAPLLATTTAPGDLVLGLGGLRLRRARNCSPAVSWSVAGHGARAARGRACGLLVAEHRRGRGDAGLFPAPQRSGRGLRSVLRPGGLRAQPAGPLSAPGAAPERATPEQRRSSAPERAASGARQGGRRVGSGRGCGRRWTRTPLLAVPEQPVPVPEAAASTVAGAAPWSRLASSSSSLASLSRSSRSSSSQ